MELFHETEFANATFTAAMNTEQTRLCSVEMLEFLIYETGYLVSYWKFAVI